MTYRYIGKPGLVVGPGHLFTEKEIVSQPDAEEVCSLDWVDYPLGTQVVEPELTISLTVASLEELKAHNLGVLVKRRVKE